MNPKLMKKCLDELSKINWHRIGFDNEGTSKDLTGSKQQWQLAFQKLKKLLALRHQKLTDIKNVDKMGFNLLNKKIPSDKETFEIFIEMIIISFN